MTDSTCVRPASSKLSAGGAFPMIVSFGLLAVPTLVSLSQKSWSQEAEAYSPVVLATGGWLLWRELPELRRRAVRGSDWLTFGVVLLSLPLYVYGRAFDSVTMEAAGVYGAGISILNLKLGSPGLKRVWFPLLYLAFAIPVPRILLDHLTAPLKHFVSFVAAGSLSSLGFPVSRQGVTITVDQYQLLVEDACSGMNSLIGLTAISLLYIYLMRRWSSMYALALICFIIPIALVANIIRVIAIILITYYLGDQVGQSFIHMAAGLFLFTVSLALVFGLDTLFSTAISRRQMAP